VWDSRGGVCVYSNTFEYMNNLCARVHSSCVGFAQRGVHIFICVYM